MLRDRRVLEKKIIWNIIRVYYPVKADGGSDAGVVGMVLVIMWLGEWVKKGEIEIK